MRFSVCVRVLLTLLAISLCGCGYHLAVGNVSRNPLLVIAERAEEQQYTVTWIDEQNLRITEWSPLGSVLTLGSYRYWYDFRFEPFEDSGSGANGGTLRCESYVKCNSAFLLFLPSTWCSDADIEEVFGWSGADWPETEREAVWGAGEWILYPLAVFVRDSVGWILGRGLAVGAF